MGQLTFYSSNIKFLIDREDEDYVFRLHKSKVYYVSVELLKVAGNVGRCSIFDPL